MQHLETQSKYLLEQVSKLGFDKCSICFRLDITHFVTTRCGHRFCLHCILKHRGNNMQYKCPLCNKLCREFSMICDIFRGLTIFSCPMCKKNKMQINEIEDHLTQKCEYRTIECKECDESILHSEMDRHTDIHTSYCKDCGEKIESNKVHECRYEIIKCHSCDKSMQRIFMEAHLNSECPRRMIQCNVCGVERTADFMKSHHKDCTLVSCMNCDDIYTCETIVLHAHICQNQKLTCSYPQCDFSCKLKDYFNHVVEDHTVVICNINECGEIVMSDNYIKHVRTQHNGKIEPVIANDRKCE